MNYIDILLILIVLLSLWSSIQKGFILGTIELICWLGGLVLAFVSYPYIILLLEKFDAAQGQWTVALSFLITLVLIRLLLSYLAERLLTYIKPQAHLTQINKIAGILPGIITGIVFASITAALLLLLPISQNLTNETRESKIAGKLSSGIEKVESIFAPVLDNVNRSISKMTIEPGSNKFIKLGFKVENPEPKPELEVEMLRLVNLERKKAGLKPLKADPEIAKVARMHSKDMFARGYFSHISPEGNTPFDRIRDAKISFLTAGENLALAQTIALAHKGLMDSPGHRANILHPSFGRLGIGVLDGGIYGLMVTQNFRN